MSPRRVVARTAHLIPERAPIRITVGQVVGVGERDTTWSEFVFITTADGSGWVPARHLSHPSGRATVLTAYDTTELPTEVGDQLDILAEDLPSGWVWCRAVTGREGWVPISTVDEQIVGS